MSITPEPSAARGDITLQPSYYTSSVFVEPLRQDLDTLTALFSDEYEGTDQPFALFKRLWTDQGWCWLHTRVFDGRGRQAFIRTVERVFTEQLAASEALLARVVALFALYTFHATKPSVSAPPVYSTSHIAIPIDIHKSLVSLPSDLKESDYSCLQPYANHVLKTLLDAQTFHILPHSSLNAQNPAILPREIFVPDGGEPSEALPPTSADVPQPTDGSAPRKKRGRPSKRDKARKAKDALTSLGKYVDKNTVHLVDEYTALSNALGVPVDTESTHVVLGQAPHGSLENYLSQKNALLAGVYADVPESSDTGSSQAALQRANEAVLARLKEIDAMAAEKGMEVGAEGGEKTGLVRVERAVDEFRHHVGGGASSGILGLLEGAGTDHRSG